MTDTRPATRVCRSDSVDDFLTRLLATGVPGVPRLVARRDGDAVTLGSYVAAGCRAGCDHDDRWRPAEQGYRRDDDDGTPPRVACEACDGPADDRGCWVEVHLGESDDPIGAVEAGVAELKVLVGEALIRLRVEIGSWLHEQLLDAVLRDAELEPHEAWRATRNVVGSLVESTEQVLGERPGVLLREADLRWVAWCWDPVRSDDTRLTMSMPRLAYSARRASA